MDACCERIFSERGEEGKGGGGGGERGGFYRRLITHRRHTGLPQKTWNSLLDCFWIRADMFVRELYTSFFNILIAPSVPNIYLSVSNFFQNILNSFEAKKCKPIITSTPCGKPAFFGSDEYFRCQGEKEMEKEREGGTFFTHTHPLFSLLPSAKERRRKGAEF